MKVVFIDYSVFVHRAVFAYRNMPNKEVPVTYTGLSMIMACLMRVGLSPDDLVIFACDSPAGSWRKDVDASYKADRRAKRNRCEDIDWNKSFFDFARLADNIQASTPFHFIEINKLEADDIIAYGVRHFSDNECVIISSDSDYEQLTAYPNVRLFLPGKKKQYKTVANPYEIIAKKIKREAADNLTSPIVTAADYERRNTIVNLLTLPPAIEQAVAEAFCTIKPDKPYDLSNLKFKRFRENFPLLYNSDKIVDPNKKPRTKSKKRKKKKHGRLPKTSV